jgi:hypothetical protein
LAERRGRWGEREKGDEMLDVELLNAKGIPCLKHQNAGRPGQIELLQNKTIQSEKLKQNNHENFKTLC